jgi:hypothetical protein
VAVQGLRDVPSDPSAQRPSIEASVLDTRPYGPGGPVGP